MKRIELTPEEQVILHNSIKHIHCTEISLMLADIVKDLTCEYLPSNHKDTTMGSSKLAMKMAVQKFQTEIWGAISHRHTSGQRILVRQDVNMEFWDESGWDEDQIVSLMVLATSKWMQYQPVQEILSYIHSLKVLDEYKKDILVYPKACQYAIEHALSTGKNGDQKIELDDMKLIWNAFGFGEFRKKLLM
jgi:hypothetical protein